MSFESLKDTIDQIFQEHSYEDVAAAFGELLSEGRLPTEGLDRLLEPFLPPPPPEVPDLEPCPPCNDDLAFKRGVLLGSSMAALGAVGAVELLGGTVQQVLLGLADAGVLPIAREAFRSAFTPPCAKAGAAPEPPEPPSEEPS